MSPLGYVGTMAAAVVAMIGGAHLLTQAPNLGVEPIGSFVRVLDGDTVAVGPEHIRIIGLDAPELHARCAAERRLADMATGRMWELAADGLTFERRGTDRYGRTLAVVRTKDGRDVADIMVGAHLARPYWGGHREGWCG